MDALALRVGQADRPELVDADQAPLSLNSSQCELDQQNTSGREPASARRTQRLRYRPERGDLRPAVGQVREDLVAHGVPLHEILLPGSTRAMAFRSWLQPARAILAAAASRAGAAPTSVA